MGLITPAGENIAEQVIELKEQKQTYIFNISQQNQWLLYLGIFLHQ